MKIDRVYIARVFQEALVKGVSRGVLQSEWLKIFNSYFTDYESINFEYFKQLEKMIRLSSSDLSYERDIEKGRRLGLKYLLLGDSGYPSQLIDLLEPPFLLEVLGDESALLNMGLGIVGSREPVEESIHWLESDLRNVLSDYALTVMSGGARGIDQVSHRLAFKLNVPTVAVLPSGLGKIYPSNLSDWVAELEGRKSCFISEFSFSQEIRKHFFQQRNRLIPALSIAVIIVEAKEKSGTMITARLSAEQGKAVYVVPAHPTHKKFRGNLNLIADGATPIAGVDHLRAFLAEEIVSYNRRHSIHRLSEQLEH